MRFDNFVNENREEDPYDVVSHLYQRSLPYIMEFIRECRPITLKSKLLFSGRSSTSVVIDSNIRKDRSPKDTETEKHYFVDEIFFKYFGVNARSASIFCSGKTSTASSYGHKVYGIFPNGNDYKIIWSPNTNDMFTDMLENGFSYVGKEIDDILRYEMDYGEDSYDDDVRDELRNEFHENNSLEDYSGDDVEEDDAQQAYDDAMEEYVDSHADERLKDRLRQNLESNKEDEEEELTAIIRREYKDKDLDKAIQSGNEIMLSGRSYTGVRYDYLPYVLRYIEVHGAKKPTPHLFASAMVGINLKLFPMRDSMKVKEVLGRLKNSDVEIDVSNPKR